jgi:hypothetical protein
MPWAKYHALIFDEDSGENQHLGSAPRGRVWRPVQTRPGLQEKFVGRALSSQNCMGVRGSVDTRHLVAIFWLWGPD